MWKPERGFHRLIILLRSNLREAFSSPGRPEAIYKRSPCARPVKMFGSRPAAFRN